MRNHAPNASREDQVSLGEIIEAMTAEGIRKGKKDAILTLGKSPTISAAIATIEADIIELERAIIKKREDGVDFDVWAA